MAKELLKERTTKLQNGVCALYGVPLPEDTSLYDTDRVLPKAEGGTYDDPSNVRTLDPRAHMERHGILRERDSELAQLKAIFDDRVQMMKLALKIGNQLLAYRRRTDDRNTETEEFLLSQMEPVKKRIDAIDRQIEGIIKSSSDLFVHACLKVPGLGPITIAALMVYVDLSKASSPSSLWKYIGIHCASHERYIKGQTSGGNRNLRTVLWNCVNSMMKNRKNPYREVYDRTKARLEISESTVKTYNTEGNLVLERWKSTKPSHRHGAALRAMMKHLLVDYWLIGRAYAGLPTRTLYAEGMLGHSHISLPESRGWEGPKVNQ